MDIDKVRALTDGELRTELATAAPPPLRPALPAGHAPADRPQPAGPDARTIARILTVMTERDLEPSRLRRTARPAHAPPAAAREPTAQAGRHDYVPRR